MLLNATEPGDIIEVTSIDRLARNNIDLQNLVKEINGKGVVIKFLKEGLTVILPFLMDRISRIKCSSMAAYHRWLDEAFHDYRTTTNGWHNPEYHLSC